MEIRPFRLESRSLYSHLSPDSFATSLSSPSYLKFIFQVRGSQTTAHMPNRGVDVAMVDPFATWDALVPHSDRVCCFGDKSLNLYVKANLLRSY